VTAFQFLVLTGVVAGILWTMTYVLIIVRAFQDRLYGMPAPAMCANISWEFIFTFLRPAIAPQIFINALWFIFDVVIMAQYLVYGRRDFPANLSRRWFYPVFAWMMASAFGAVLVITIQMHDQFGIYAAASQNWLMSILFITMLVRRNGIAGQSFYIALTKMLGSAISYLGFYVYDPSAVYLDFVFVSLFIADVVYTAAVYRKSREVGVNPLTDFLKRAPAVPLGRPLTQ
jgi:hypothetical protein